MHHERAGKGREGSNGGLFIQARVRRNKSRNQKLDGSGL